MSSEDKILEVFEKLDLDLDLTLDLDLGLSLDNFKNWISPLDAMVIF